MAFIYHVEDNKPKITMEYEAGGNKYSVVSNEDPHPDLVKAYKWLNEAMENNWIRHIGDINTTKFWTDLLSVKIKMDSDSGEEFIIFKFDACLGTFSMSITTEKYPLDSDADIARAWERLSMECHAFLFEGKRSQGDLFDSASVTEDSPEEDGQLLLPAPPLLLGMGDPDDGDGDDDGSGSADEAEFEEVTDDEREDWP